MSDNLNTPAFDFGIQNTMEMGMGNPELLNDLMSPETSTADVDTLKEIVKETTLLIPEKIDKPPKGKEIVQKEEGETLTDQDVLRNFLGDDDEQEDVDELESVIEKKEEQVEETSQFTALSNDLFKLGVFSKEEDEEDITITTPEEFLERFTSEKKKGAIEIVNNFIGQFGEDYQAAFDAIFVKGVNPKEYFGIYNNVADFASLDLTNEENQIKVMRQALTDQEFDPEDITTEIDRIKNYGDLESVATKHHKVLVKKETAKLQQMEQKAEQELQQKTLIKNQYIQNVQNILQEKLKTKEFDGIPINPKLVNELQDFLLVDKYKTTSGETLTDFDKTVLELKRPENHVLKVKFGLLLKIMEKDPTLSTIQRSGVSKKSDQLFSEMAKQKTTEKNSVKPKTSSWFQ